MLEVSSKTRSDALREQRAFKTRRQPVLNVVIYTKSRLPEECARKGETTRRMIRELIGIEVFFFYWHGTVTY